MKRLEYFMCEICSTKYNNSEEAISCEASHPSLLNKIVVVETRFENLEGKYSIDRWLAQNIPSRLKIHYGMDKYEYGVYKLERYGR